MLATLPVELLDLVIEKISSRGDLKKLCEVCKYLYDVTIPHLYQSLLLPAPELSLEHLSARLEATPRRLLKYTQEFGFSVPIHERVKSRCVHHNDDGLHDMLAESLTTDGNWDKNTDEDTDDDTEKDRNEGFDNGHLLDPLLHLARTLDSLRFPDDQLRSFRWEVGTCFPKSLFCGNDSFFGNQRQIESITLITDSECGVNNDTLHLVELVPFRQLRHLDWRGLNRFDDFQSVKECLKAHGHQIQSLTLDLLTWARAEEIWANGHSKLDPHHAGIPDNFFSRTVLDIHPADKKVVFRSLERLHLSAVSFYYTGVEMVHAFNIDHLKALKLRNCPGSLDWLRTIINSGKSMELESLELALDVDSLQRDAYMHLTETMSKFIQRVSGLESLYLMLPTPIDWTVLADRISYFHHIKRFVIHHLVDRGGQKLIDGDIPWSFHLQQILQKPRLTCFGCSMGPRELSSHFQKMQPRPSCKLVHIRLSGVVLERLASAGQSSWSSTSLYVCNYGDDFPYKPEEIYDFAQWAFSCDGLPNLQVLACGDFSYKGRYSKFNLLLCKSDNGYQTLTPSNVSSWDLVQDNMDMLAACPLDDILE